MGQKSQEVIVQRDRVCLCLHKKYFSATCTTRFIKRDGCVLPCLVPKGWEYQAITLNHGVKAKKHIDSKNVGKSVIIGIGNFTGGEIGVWRSDNTKPVYKNLHDKPIMFNGGLLPHETQPFEGNRYTMVFYKQGRKPRSGKIGVGAGTATPGNPEGMGSGAIFA